MRRQSAQRTTDDVAAGLSLSVTRLARLLRQQEDSGLTPSTTSALATIARFGPLAVGDLADIEQVAPPTISKLITKLEELGLVRLGAWTSSIAAVCRVELTASGAPTTRAEPVAPVGPG